MAGAPCGACGQGCGSGQCPASQQGAAPQGQAQGCVPPPTEPARPRRPELLNRLDEVLVFRSLGRADVRAIAELELRQVAARLAARGVALEVSGPVMALICARGYDQARPRAAPRPQAGPTPARRATRAAPRSPACRHGASGLPGACAPHALRVRRSKRCCPGLRSEGDGVLPAACRGVGWPAGHDKWMADRSSSARATRAAPQAYGARPLRRALAALLEDPLADALLMGLLPPGSTARADVDAAGTVVIATGDVAQPVVSGIVASTGLAKRRESVSVSA